MSWEDLGMTSQSGTGSDGRGMARTQYYTASSLDGFIATIDHSLDWLVTRRREPDGALSYAEFTADVGAIAMGSRTYEWILAHEATGPDGSGSGWPYDLPCWVFTHRELPVVAGADVRFVRDDVSAVHPQMLAAAGGRNVWVVGGGDLAGQLADAGLLDDVLVMVAPVTLGAGAPLLPRRLELVLRDVDRNGDFACLRYAVAR
jgi:dihydrofolate reductase